MILDIIAVAIIVFCVYNGIRKGMVKAFFSTATLILALVLTFVTVNPVSEYVKQTSFGETVYEKTQIEFLDAEDFEQAQKFLENFELSKVNLEENAAEAVIGLENELSLNIGNAVIRSVCAVALFILYYFALKIIAKLLDVVCKLPVLKTFNRAGGFIAGILNAYITLIIFSCIIMLLLSTDAGEYLTKQLSESFLTAWIYQNNILV